MEILTTISQNSPLIQNLGIIGSLLVASSSLLLAVTSFRDQKESKRSDTLIKLTSEHRQIWRDYRREEKLARIRRSDINLEMHPVTDAERHFVQSVILHLNASFYAHRVGTHAPPERLGDDVRQFLRRPIPAAVYRDHKPLLDSDFKNFIDNTLSS